MNKLLLSLIIAATNLTLQGEGRKISADAISIKNFGAKGTV
jgi:hypothetical protein